MSDRPGYPGRTPARAWPQVRNTAARNSADVVGIPVNTSTPDPELPAGPIAIKVKHRIIDPPQFGNQPKRAVTPELPAGHVRVPVTVTNVIMDPPQRGNQTQRAATPELPINQVRRPDAAAQLRRSTRINTQSTDENEQVIAQVRDRRPGRPALKDLYVPKPIAATESESELETDGSPELESSPKPARVVLDGNNRSLVGACTCVHQLIANRRPRPPAGCAWRG